MAHYITTLKKSSDDTTITLKRPIAFIEFKCLDNVMYAALPSSPVVQFHGLVELDDSEALLRKDRYPLIKVADEHLSTTVVHGAEVYNIPTDIITQYTAQVLALINLIK